jgi:hypothetical protein
MHQMAHFDVSEKQELMVTSEASTVTRAFIASPS